MRCLGIALLTLLIATAAMAFDRSPTPPATNQTLLVVAPAETPRIDIEIGAAEITTHAAHVRVAYLPRLAPLPATFPRDFAPMPNAFELLGTQLPYRRGLRP